MSRLATTSLARAPTVIILIRCARPLQALVSRQSHLFLVTRWPRPPKRHRRDHAITFGFAAFRSAVNHRDLDVFARPVAGGTNWTLVDLLRLVRMSAAFRRQALRTARRAAIRDAAQMANASRREQAQCLFGRGKRRLCVMEMRVPGVRQPVHVFPCGFRGRLQELAPGLLARPGKNAVGNHPRPSNEVGSLERRIGRFECRSHPVPNERD